MTTEPRVETRKQMGSVTVKDEHGQLVKEPIELTITDTFYESGRKDVHIKVPRLGTKSKARKS